MIKFQREISNNIYDEITAVSSMSGIHYEIKVKEERQQLVKGWVVTGIIALIAFTISFSIIFFVIKTH